jgi:hypothetical protein
MGERSALAKSCGELERCQGAITRPFHQDWGVEIGELSCLAVQQTINELISNILPVFTLVENFLREFPLWRDFLQVPLSLLGNDNLP